MKSIKLMIMIVLTIITTNLLNAQFGNLDTNKLKGSAKKAAEKKAADAKKAAEKKANELKDSANSFAYSQFKNVAKDIPFKQNSARLNLNDPDYKVNGISLDKFMKETLIPALAQLIKSLPAGKRVHIIGHASRLGSEKEKGTFKGNVWLSKQRAGALLLYLKANSKLDSRRFRIIGKGSNQLKNTSKPSSEENCRVSFDIGN